MEPLFSTYKLLLLYNLLNKLYFNKMSDSEDEEPKMTEEEVTKQVTEKVFEAFKEFDADGNGSHVKTD